LIDSPPHTIVISIIGNLDALLIEEVRSEISRIFGFPTEMTPLLGDVDFAFDTFRDQYHSTIILEKLADLAPPHAVKVLAITKVDLFIPVLTYVYGEAQLGGKSCIVSTYRLNEGLPLISSHENFYQRLSKEAIHEIGHTFNLRHCRDRSCIMHYCRTIEDVDKKSNQLCRYCRVLLDDELKKMKI